MSTSTQTVTTGITLFDLCSLWRNAVNKLNGITRVITDYLGGTIAANPINLTFDTWINNSIKLGIILLLKQKLQDCVMYNPYIHYPPELSLARVDI